MNNLNLNYLLSTKPAKILSIVFLVIVVVLIAIALFPKAETKLFRIIKGIGIILGSIILTTFIVLMIYEQIQDRVLYKKWAMIDKKKAKDK